MTATYPHQDGDFTVLGPGIFTDGKVINWKGKNYEPQPEPLTDAERTFFSFALDQAAEEMFHRDGFTDEDWAALAKFRRMIGAPTA
jgi:hypothetical protein